MRVQNLRAVKPMRQKESLRSRSLTELRHQAVEEIVRQIHAHLGDSVRIYLFGSMGRGDYGITSDIDLGLDAEGPIAVERLAELREQLEDSTIPYFVDLVDLNAVSPSFRKKILEEAMLWRG
jgi:predicted nucleotidyltransferase